MASSLRLPAGHSLSTIRSGKGIRPFYPVVAPPCQCRHFSQAPRVNTKAAVAQSIPRQRPAQPSMRSRARTVTRADMPQDLGLLAGTFIRPLWSNMPSIMEQPKERLLMEWLWVKTSFANFVGLIKYHKSDNSGLKIGFKQRRQIARSLHKRMYTAFANGDIPTLNKVCCPGLAQDLNTRIRQRRSDEKVTWALEKYRRTPSTLFTGVRILSDRATTLPEIADAGVRQIVVRITSRQSKGRAKLPSTRNAKESRSEPEDAPAASQNCVEHIVLQRLRFFGRDEPWRIWGHTSPTSVEELDTPAFAPGLSVAERVEAMKQMAGR